MRLMRSFLATAIAAAVICMSITLAESASAAPKPRVHYGIFPEPTSVHTPHVAALTKPRTSRIATSAAPVVGVPVPKQLQDLGNETPEFRFPEDSCYAVTFEGIEDGQDPSTVVNGGESVLGVSFSSLDAVAVVDSDAGGSASIANEPSPSTVVAGGSDLVRIDFPTKCHSLGFAVTGNTTINPTIMFNVRKNADEVVPQPNSVRLPEQTAQPDPTGAFTTWTTASFTLGSSSKNEIYFDILELFPNLESSPGGEADAQAYFARSWFLDQVICCNYDLKVPQPPPPPPPPTPTGDSECFSAAQGCEVVQASSNSKTCCLSFRADDETCDASDPAPIPCPNGELLE